MSDGKAINELFRLIDEQSKKIEAQGGEIKRLKTGGQPVDVRAVISEVVNTSFINKLYKKGGAVRQERKLDLDMLNRKIEQVKRSIPEAFNSIEVIERLDKIEKSIPIEFDELYSQGGK